jgi:signal transduction histidine kinase
MVMTGPTVVKAIRKQSAPELELRIQESELANRHKSEFLASMSHELRTPLHTIIGFSELLAEETKGPLNADQKRFIGHIRKDSQHLLTLINEILDLSKIEAGKVELRRETLDIGALLEGVLTAVCSHGVENKIAFETRIDGPVLVNGDRLRVRQILYNLLSNAVKFTPPWWAHPSRG